MPPGLTPPTISEPTRLRTLVDRLLDRLVIYSHFYNPWRKTHRVVPLGLRIVLLPVIRLGLICGFRNIDYGLVAGSRSRLHVGTGCSTLNTVFNVASGHIWIGDHTLFSNDCQLLTGVHRFYQGRRASLQSDAPYPEVPEAGRDILIGQGCFFGAGAVIIGPCVIGDNAIIGAGAVVTSDVPANSFVGGVPAKVIGRTDALGADQ